MAQTTYAHVNKWEKKVKLKGFKKVAFIHSSAIASSIIL
jgi:hypothetical protein